MSPFAYFFVTKEILHFIHFAAGHILVVMKLHLAFYTPPALMPCNTIVIDLPVCFPCIDLSYLYVFNSINYITKFCITIYWFYRV